MSHSLTQQRHAWGNLFKGGKALPRTIETIGTLLRTITFGNYGGDATSTPPRPPYFLRVCPILEQDKGFYNLRQGTYLVNREIGNEMWSYEERKRKVEGPFKI